MIDSEFVNMLHEVEDADVSLQECFSSVFELVMSITDSAGNEVELVAGGEGIPDEQDVPAHDRGWLHHCDHHLRGNRRHLCRNVLIQSSAKLSGSFRRTALFIKSVLHIQKKPLQ